ncbi:MAG TPA: biopolymer transporter ExbD [Spirochaetota bacterium]|jgi:biopolymer transport protein ExbD|nr:biopolymer transporter ExbD [Spirochaetota bacterium]HOH37363.1 biopolymer transporter ExbD [Spirochaetota bacterium]HPJ13734.1 biopolymer transporter ExbD [Spirochaetota bacterium]HPM33426.1 biopolymer transporter ExbD [Spirochaetota bacterium]
MSDKIKLTSRREYKSLIDITPMIDLVFLLVIFFMVTSSLGKISSINVNLPRADKSDENITGEAVVSINKDNEIFFNDVKVDSARIMEEAEKLADFKGKIIIRADREANYESVVSVIDALNKKGVKNFVLAAVKN